MKYCCDEFKELAKVTFFHFDNCFDVWNIAVIVLDKSGELELREDRMIFHCPFCGRKLK